MKINDIWIPAAAVILVFAVIIMSQLGISIAPILGYVILIVLIVYLLIAARCCLVKMQEPKTAADLNARIDMLKESLDRIEEKVNKIDRILEKVSE